MIMSLEKAVILAKALNEDDADDWMYEVEVLADEKARIAIYDEEGTFVEYL